MMDTIKAWQCIGCGKLEAPQNCIGVCQDRRVELVYASAYAAQAVELARLQAQRDGLRALVRRVATLEGEDTAALAALRGEARRIMADVERDDAAQSPTPPGAALAPGDASGPLRDRRSGADLQKSRLTRPATLFVR
jgi:hypothetical protein